MLYDLVAIALTVFTLALFPWILWISILSPEAREADWRDALKRSEPEQHPGPNSPPPSE